MDSGRMPACVSAPLVGSQNTSVPVDVLIGQDANKYYPSMQPPAGGNRCGHDKNCFKTPQFHAKDKRRPHVIEEAKRRIGQAISEIYRFPLLTELFYHSAEKGKSGRRRRSESVEGAIWLTLTTCLQSLNLVKMACGHYDNKNQFHYYNFAYIENKTDQTAVRVKRGMAVLQEEGLVKVETLREQNNDGSWRTKEVRIHFTDKIFEMLELMDEFLKDRETISIKFHAKQERLDRNQQKKSLYRKPNFPSKRQAKPEVDLKGCVNRLTKPYKPVSKGRGLEIRDLYQSLISKGISPTEAAEIIKTKYPPLQ